MQRPLVALLVFGLSATLAAAELAAAELKLGKPLSLTQSSTVTDLLARPDPLVGKTVQVKGKVTEVCQMMGCWMALVDPESAKSVRIKVNDGVIVIPKEAVGKMAVAEGPLNKLQLTKEQAIGRAKHEAEEQGRKFDPSTITSGQTIYQIQASGIIVSK
ncbi:MAG: DUF4920 domain-containing protein [Bryobacterales bacterium]|nr:DUF4920 domain-containing protein [Bryobacterales bacterium]